MSIEELFNIFDNCKKRSIYVQIDDLGFKSDIVPPKSTIDKSIGLIYCLNYKNEVFECLNEEGSAFVSYRIIGFYDNGKEIHDFLFRQLKDFQPFTGNIFTNKEFNKKEYNIDILLVEEDDCVEICSSSSSDEYDDDSFFDSSYTQEEEEEEEEEEVHKKKSKIDILIDGFINFVRHEKVFSKDLINFDLVWKNYLRKFSNEISFTEFQKINVDEIKKYVSLMIDDQEELVEEEIVKDEEEIVKHEEEIVKDEEEIVKHEGEEIVKDEEEIVKHEEEVDKDEEEIVKDEEEETVKDEEEKEEEETVKDEEEIIKEEGEIVKEGEDIVKDEEEVDKDEDEEEKKIYLENLKKKRKNDLLDIAIDEYKIKKWLDKNIRFYNKQDIIEAILYHRYKI